MAARYDSIKSIDQNSARDYFMKAKEFYENMITSFNNKQWNTTGLTAVHCAISTNDALLAHFAGIRNTSQDHKSAVKLLLLHVPDKQSQEQSEHFRKIVVLKNLIEYERRSFTEKDATEIKKHTERFFDWARQKLKY